MAPPLWQRPTAGVGCGAALWRRTAATPNARQRRATRGSGAWAVAPPLWRRATAGGDCGAALWRRSSATQNARQRRVGCGAASVAAHNSRRRLRRRSLAALDSDAKCATVREGSSAASMAARNARQQRVGGGAGSLSRRCGSAWAATPLSGGAQRWHATRGGGAHRAAAAARRLRRWLGGRRSARHTTRSSGTLNCVAVAWKANTAVSAGTLAANWFWRQRRRWWRRWCPSGAASCGGVRSGASRGASVSCDAAAPAAAKAAVRGDGSGVEENATRAGKERALSDSSSTTVRKVGSSSAGPSNGSCIPC